MTRRISIEEAVGIVDGGMITGAVTPEVRAAWLVCRAELRRLGDVERSSLRDEITKRERNPLR